LAGFGTCLFEEIMSDTLEVSTIETLTPDYVFQRAGGVEDIVSKLEADVRAIPMDATTEKGRKHIKSVAHRVSRSKTLLDDMGKFVQADARKLVDSVNADRRLINARLDALRDEVRKPVDEYEAREEARVNAHKASIQEILVLAHFDVEPTEIQVGARLETLEKLQSRDFQEFSARAAQAANTVREMLNDYHQEATERRIAAEQEAIRVQQEAEAARVKAEEDRKAREAEIARQAAETARLKAEAEAEQKRLSAEAEAKRQKEAAAVEQRRVESERQAAIQRAEQAERDRIAAQEEAVRRERAAAEKAEQDKQAAIEAERRRVAQAEAAEREKQARREANKAHRAKINREILSALMGAINEDDAKAVITLVARGEVPHMVISY